MGGYTSRGAIYLQLGIYILLVCCGIPAPFTDNLAVFIALFWMVLFCAGFIEPSLTGIILNTVNKLERPIASSFGSFFYNVFGYIPAPYFYGAIRDLTAVYDEEGNNVSRVAF